MGAIGGLLGVSGGAGGSGFSGPVGTPIQQPVTAGDAQMQYQNALNNQQQQNAFANSVLNQNGLQNQSSVFNQMQGIANGTGPNPAQAMLNQATGANTANQAALMAGQRGAGANPALIARQAAMQGAANQQNAAGQAATMQANQSLGALNQMGGMATNQANQAQTAVSAANQGAQALQGNLLNAIGAQNNASVGMQSNINQGNAGLANTSMQGQQGLIGGLMNKIGPAGAMMGAEGGMVPRFAEGGMTGPQSALGQMFAASVAAPAQPSFSQIPLESGPNAGADALKKGASNMKMPQMGGSSGFSGNVAGGAGDAGGMADMPMVAAEGGKVPALVSPGEKYLPPSEVKKVEQGKKSAIAAGETIPGKPTVGGAKNDYANDTVKKTLDEGGIILPRSVTQAKNPAQEAHKFVSAIMAKNGKRLPKKGK